MSRFRWIFVLRSAELFAELFFAIICLLCTAQANATPFSTAVAADSITPPTFHVTVGASASSRYTFRGRVDDEVGPIFSPLVRLSHTSGVMIFGSAMMFPAFQSGIDSYAAGASYSHEFTDEFSMGLRYTHTWYAERSLQFNAALANTASVNAEYDAEFIVADVYADYSFGTTTDFALTMMLSHDVTLWRSGARFYGILEPSIVAIAATQTVFENYVQRQVERNRLGRTIIVTRTQQRSSRDFDLMDCELSLPLMMKFGSLRVSPIFNLAFPLNTQAGETSKPFGYASCVVSWTF
jgi:hypothetical protein